MLFQRLNRTDPEKVDMMVLNVEGATITTGNAVALVLGTSNDGVSAVIANSAGDMPGFIGIALKDIPNNAYGLVRIAGFVNSILLSNVGTSLTINAGDPLVPGAAGLFSAAPTYANSGFRFILASNVPVAVSAAAYASGLLKMI